MEVALGGNSTSVGHDTEPVYVTQVEPRRQARGVCARFNTLLSLLWLLRIATAIE